MNQQERRNDDSATMLFITTTGKDTKNEFINIELHGKRKLKRQEGQNETQKSMPYFYKVCIWKLYPRCPNDSPSGDDIACKGCQKWLLCAFYAVIIVQQLQFLVEHSDMRLICKLI